MFVEQDPGDAGVEPVQDPGDDVAADVPREREVPPPDAGDLVAYGADLGPGGFDQRVGVWAGLAEVVGVGQRVAVAQRGL